jgi:hypothetical protein
MAEDKDMGRSFEGEGSLWVIFYEELNRARHDDGERTPHSTGTQRLAMVQARILLSDVWKNQCFEVFGSRSWFAVRR